MNLDDLRVLVQNLTRKGVRVESVKEQLVFTGEDSPTANLMLSVMDSFAEFERSLIMERQREGIALAQQRGAYKGRKKTLPQTRAAELVQRAANGIPKPVVAATMASAGRASVKVGRRPEPRMQALDPTRTRAALRCFRFRRTPCGCTSSFRSLQATRLSGGFRFRCVRRLPPPGARGSPRRWTAPWSARG